MYKPSFPPVSADLQETNEKEATMPSSLPPKPNLEQLKKQAKDLLKSHKNGDVSACETFKLINRYSKLTTQRILQTPMSLRDAQFAIALSYGFKGWHDLAEYVEAIGVTAVYAETRKPLKNTSDVMPLETVPGIAERLRQMARKELPLILSEEEKTELLNSLSGEVKQAFCADDMSPVVAASWMDTLLHTDARFVTFFRETTGGTSIRSVVFWPTGQPYCVQGLVFLGVRELYEEAKSCYENIEYRKARVVSELLIEKYPETREATWATGIIEKVGNKGAKEFYAEGESAYRQSLADVEKVLGEEHPNLSGILYALADLHLKHGKYAEARPLYKRALAIDEKALGKSHPDVATCLINLGKCYEKMGELEEAERYRTRAMQIGSKRT